MKKIHLARSASYLAIITSVLLIIMKTFGVFLTHSLSLQASLFDSCLDGGVSVLNAFAIHQALKPADQDHRFGHGKFEALVGLIQSFFIALSASWLVYEAWKRWYHPQTIVLDVHVIWIMVLATLLTLGLVMWQEHVIKHTKSLVVSSDCLHYKADIVTNIAAILGCIGGAKFAKIDIICGTGIAVYIFWTSWSISKKSFDVLMDRELDEKTREAITKVVFDHPQIQGMHDLRTRSAGQKDFAQFHLDLHPELSVREAHKITEEVEELLNKSFPQLEVLIHQDPSHECACYSNPT